MRYLGLDVGEKRIGVAVGDDETKLALELAAIEKENFFDKFSALVEEEKPDKIIVGLPISLSGKEEQQARTIRDFARDLEKLNIPIEFQDERLSSVEAEKILRELGLQEAEIKERIDAASAAVILQDYLDKSQITNNK